MTSAVYAPRATVPSVACSPKHPSVSPKPEDATASDVPHPKWLWPIKCARPSEVVDFDVLPLDVASQHVLDGDVRSPHLKWRTAVTVHRHRPKNDRVRLNYSDDYNRRGSPVRTIPTLVNEPGGKDRNGHCRATAITINNSNDNEHVTSFI